MHLLAQGPVHERRCLRLPSPVRCRAYAGARQCFFAVMHLQQPAWHRLLACFHDPACATRCEWNCHACSKKECMQPNGISAAASPSPTFTIHIDVCKACVSLQMMVMETPPSPGVFCKTVVLFLLLPPSALQPWFCVHYITLLVPSLSQVAWSCRCAARCSSSASAASATAP